MSFDLDLSIRYVVWSLLVAIVFARTLFGVVWRLFLSPIAHIPGPRFAALTFWNEFYYDVVLGGQYTWKLEEYHKKYGGYGKTVTGFWCRRDVHWLMYLGPIIRINPYEVHIRDSYFHDKLYVGSSKRKSDKWYWAMRMFAQEDSSIFDTIGHEKHRMRREPWNPYFSKQSVSRLQPTLIRSKVDKLCERLAEHQAAGKPVVMIYAYSTVTIDIISEYSYPEGYNYLGDPEFNTQNYDAFIDLSKMCHILKQFSILIPILKSIPLGLVKHLSPNTYSAFAQREVLLEQARKLQQRKKTEGAGSDGKRPSLLEAILDSSLPESEKTASRIADEAQTVIAAGTLTSSHQLKHATYHILANRVVHERLMAELERAIPDLDSPPTLNELENLEYLNAIMYESLRGSHGVAHRLQRLFPDQSIQYRQWTVPPGTPMSMTSIHIHDDPDIFPDPYTYKPERWLPMKTEGQRLQRFLVSWGGGSRGCIGKDLSKAEILTTLAMVFRRFGRVMELYDTDRVRDIDISKDFFNALPSEKSNGLKVLFRKE